MSQEKYDDANTVTVYAVDINTINNQVGTKQSLGTAVQVDGSLKMYGEAMGLYQLVSQNIAVNKFKRMSLNYNIIETGTLNAIICIYEKIISLNETSCEYQPRCSTLKPGINTINLGSLFDDAMTSVQVIGFTQIRGLSQVSDLRIYSDPETQLVDLDDNCADINARRIRSMGASGCVCMDGYYASSNGGKLQGRYDTCLSCLSTDVDPTCSTLAGTDASTCAKVSLFSLYQITIMN